MLGWRTRPQGSSGRPSTPRQGWRAQPLLHHFPARPCSTHPHSRAVGVTVPVRAARTPDALKSNLSLLSARPSQRGMLWFLTPLPARLPCCGRKPASWWHPEPHSEPRAKQVLWAPCGTGSLLRVSLAAHTALPAPCSAGPCATHTALLPPCTMYTACTVGTLQCTHPTPWAWAMLRYPEGKQSCGISGNVRAG